ncbi:MAG TPA: MBL fold metallo-hydrolase [Planctomycetota bacterium]|nr:MBL fold metallo-hydrolase [Planctomycetota bacterium]
MLAATALVLVAAAAALVWLTSHPPLEPRPGRVLEVAADGAPGLRARWLGCTTLAFDDGETQLLVDGFFSRPGPLRVLLGRIAPDDSRIEAGLARAGVERAAAVLTAHSHYDHAMDAPVVAARTGAVLVGSRSTAWIARGLDFPEERVRVVAGGERLTFGRFTVTVHRALHTPRGVGTGEITAPLVPPARFSAYREGGCFSYLIEHDGRGLLVHPSTHFVRGAFADVRAEVVFLGTATLGRLDDAFVREWWRETVEAVGARLVVPIHWDDFLAPPEPAPLPMPRYMDDYPRGMLRLGELARESGVEVGWMPVFEPVAVLARD